MDNMTTSSGLKNLSNSSIGNHPIVCLPHAGGGANFIRSLLPYMTTNADVWSFEYPGHLGRLAEPPAPSLEALANEICAAVLNQRLNRPVVFGHSMGGKVAFEAALLLEAMGKEVHTLIVSGCEPPESRPRRQLSTASRAELINEIASMGGVPQLVLESNDFLKLFLDVIRNDYRLLENYRRTPLARLKCPILVLSGEADSTARSTEMAAWVRSTAANTRFITFPGGHFFPMEHPSMVAAELLASCQNPRAKNGVDSTSFSPHSFSA